MTKKLAALLTANKARWIPAITAFISGGIAQLITSKGLQLPGDLAVALSGMVALAVGWFFEKGIAALNSEGVAKIQDALPGIAPTGTVNAGTVAMVERLADRVDAPAAAPAHGLSLAEGAEIKRFLYKICRDRPELLAELRKAVHHVQTENEKP